MTGALKLYRVTFTDTRYMRIELKARSARAATANTSLSLFMIRDK